MCTFSAVATMTLQLRPLYFLLDNSVKVQLQDDRKAKISGDLNPEIRKQTTGMFFFSRVLSFDLRSEATRPHPSETSPSGDT